MPTRISRATGQRLDTPEAKKQAAQVTKQKLRELQQFLRDTKRQPLSEQALKWLR
jgi:hypothetical protein